MKVTTFLIILILLSIPVFAEDVSKKSDSWHSEGATPTYSYRGLFSNWWGNSCYIFGYNNCWQREDSYQYGCALAQWNAKIAYSMPERKYCPNLGWYTLNDYKIKYKCVGDRAYALFSKYNVECNKYSCQATESPKEGYFTVSNAVGNVKDNSIYLICHDDDFDTCGGNTVHTGGYVSYNIKLGNDYILNCCDNSDCGTGMMCDKTESYTNWHCKADPCYGIDCKDRCIGTVKYTNGHCIDGNCQFTETKAKSYCAEQTAFYNGYCVGNNIDYTEKLCKDHCSGTTIYQSSCIDGTCIRTPITTAKNYCIDDERYHNGVCKDNKLIYETEHCVFGCTNGTCNPTVQPPEPDTESYLRNLINSIRNMLAELWGLILDIMR